MFMIRLDDASEFMDIEKWNKMERLLSKYKIFPIFGIIPENKDPNLTGKYEKNKDFWIWVSLRCESGWTPALHGYNHLFLTNEGGLNPVNQRSEFAGVELCDQKRMIREAYSILNEHGIRPVIFFAPGHTFDSNTIIALKDETQIRIISDMIATDIYYNNEIYYIPQQTGKCRNLPFKLVTFCYHPNTMNDNDFDYLDKFIHQHRNKFIGFNDLSFNKRDLNLWDRFVRSVYFIRRK